MWTRTPYRSRTQKAVDPFHDIVVTQDVLMAKSPALIANHLDKSQITVIDFVAGLKNEPRERHNNVRFRFKKANR